VWLCKKEKYRKNGQVSKYLKEWVLRCLKKKKEIRRKKKIEEKRDSPYSLAKVFKC
jgi:hypothetical protein